MFRRLFTGLTVLSLVLCLTAASLLFESVRSPNYPSPPTRGATGSVIRDRGLWLYDGQLEYGSFTWHVGDWEVTGDGNLFRINLRVMTAGTAFLPLAFAGWRLRNALFVSRAKRLGSCLTCGYNLTGNTSRVCPECGTPTAAGANP